MGAKIFYLSYNRENISSITRKVRNIKAGIEIPDKFWFTTLYKDFVNLCDAEIDADNPNPALEEIFIQLNYCNEGDITDVRTWDLLRELVDKKELDHTSMSAGDIIQDTNTGRMWICESFGWKEIFIN